MWAGLTGFLLALVLLNVSLFHWGWAFVLLYLLSGGLLAWAPAGRGRWLGYAGFIINLVNVILLSPMLLLILYANTVRGDYRILAIVAGMLGWQLGAFVLWRRRQRVKGP